MNKKLYKPRVMEINNRIKILIQQSSEEISSKELEESMLESEKLFDELYSIFTITEDYELANKQLKHKTKVQEQRYKLFGYVN